MTQYNAEKLQKIKTFPHLVQYLRDDLEWPIDTEDFTELTFEYKPEELGIDPKYAVKIEEIQQLRPLVTGQPWGIFFVKFGKNKLSVVALRKILSQLVIKKRESMRKADQPTWHLHDLLFISNFCEDNERKITFAKFTQNEETNDLPTLKVLGWDEGDTVLRMEHVQQQLYTSLRWPKDEKKVDDWRIQWSSAFTLGRCEIIRTSQELAIRLADLARKIRIRALQVITIESEKGPLRTLHKAFREALIHDLSEEDFADMYAQTIAYGLLAARVSRPMGITADNMADMVPITNPFLKEMLSIFLTVGGRKSDFNFDELGVQDIVDLLNNPGTHMEDVLRDFGNKTQREDPVIYFYELFLKEYDSQKKVERGVFYTPQPVVSYIVRSVHELLQTEFGLVDGLASTITWGEMIKKNPDLKLPVIRPGSPANKDSKDITISAEEPFVTILDPATGTATFLVEVIEIIHNTMIKKWEREGLKAPQISQKWNEYIPRHLLPRLYGFELMMAPYAIAHMKIGLKLHETGYKFESDERVRVYLTNSLEPASDSVQRDLTYYSEALAHEATAVNEVKRNKRFPIIIGNPPYSARSYNLTDFARSIIEPYKSISGERIKEKGALQLEKNLNDDYVKFIRLGQILILKQGIGILGYITNNSFLENPTLRGMRWTLLQDFNNIQLVNLHGNFSQKEKTSTGEKDENVFDIGQGVSISLSLKKPNSSNNQKVKRFDLFGSQNEKYGWLLKNSCSSLKIVSFNPTLPFFLFKAENVPLKIEYYNYFNIIDIFPLNSTGVKTHRDNFCIDFNKSELELRINDLHSEKKTDDEIRLKYDLEDTYGWKLHRCRERLRNRLDWKNSFNQFFYRPLDFRWIYFHPDVVELARWEVMHHLLNGKNFGLIFMRQVAVHEEYSHFFVSRYPVDNRAFYSNRGTMSLAPLYLTDNGIKENISQKVRNHFCQIFGMKWISIGNGDLKATFGPEDIFHYIYGISHSPMYRKRYAEFLKGDFPRIPVPKVSDLFKEIIPLGATLATIHLMESTKLNAYITKFTGTMPSCDVDKITYSDNTVWINKAKTQGFRGIPANIWNFHIGGYQVCEKWLKDRKGRQLSAEDIAHYQKITVALNETIRIMGEIDEVIEKHGGWPGAFDTSGAGAEAAAGVAEQQTLFGDDPA